MKERVCPNESCPLHGSAPVWADEDCAKGQVDVLFVGEAPGREEDQQGKPFVGQSGRLFRSILQSYIQQYGSFSYVITNIVKCRPPDNRTPTSKEIKACLPYLEDEIRRYSPKRIVCLGNTAKRVLPKTVKSSWGYIGDLNGIPVWAIWHPAYVLRNSGLLKEYANMFAVAVGSSVGTADIEMDIVDMDPAVGLDCASNPPFIAIDTESTELDYHKSSLLSVAIAVNARKVFWLDVRKHGEKASREVLQRIVSMGSTLVFHNAKYDLNVLRAFGVEVPLDVDVLDTYVAHYLLDTSTSHGLKLLAQFVLGWGTYADRAEEVGWDLTQLSTNELRRYNCLDAIATYRLMESFWPRLWEEGLAWLFTRLMGPLSKVLASMEYYGVRISEEQLSRLKQRFALEMAKIDQEMLSLPEVVGFAKQKKRQDPKFVFNPNSTKQLRELLFDYCGLPAGKKTSTGANSTDVETIQSLLEQFPDNTLLQLLVKRRKVHKLDSTYIKGILKRAKRDAQGNLTLHTEYNMARTESGRLSSSNPNLQNIPHEEGKDTIKTLFVPRYDYLVNMDYSQLELRVAAMLSGDASMIEAFQSGRDIHREVAGRIFEKSPDEVTHEERYMAKTVSFGVLYGMNDYGLADRLDISREEANKLITDFFRRYPDLAEWLVEMERTVVAKGELQNLLGRKRRFPRVGPSTDSHELGAILRQARNFPIQSLASDMTLLSLINGYRYLVEKGFRARPVLTVHDSIVLDAPKEEVMEVVHSFVDIMEHPERLVPKDVQEYFTRVPFKVGIEIGANWGEMEEVRLA